MGHVNERRNSYNLKMQIVQTFIDHYINDLNFVGKMVLFLIFIVGVVVY